MNTQTFFLRSATALVCLAMLPSLHAATVTYDFSVAVTSGPASGSTASGYFSYDSASVNPVGYNGVVGLLTDLVFDLDGTSYTEASANTGSLRFNSLGVLTSFLIGTNCGAGSCAVSNGSTGWAIILGGLDYARAGVDGIFSGSAPTFTLRNSAVPEPASWALVLAGGLPGLHAAAEPVAEASAAGCPRGRPQPAGLSCAAASLSGALVCLMNICAATMPTSYRMHIGMASASCEITSGGVTTADTMNAPTTK